MDIIGDWDVFQESKQYMEKNSKPGQPTPLWRNKSGLVLNKRRESGAPEGIRCWNYEVIVIESLLILPWLDICATQRVHWWTQSSRACALLYLRFWNIWPEGILMQFLCWSYIHNCWVGPWMRGYLVTPPELNSIKGKLTPLYCPDCLLRHIFQTLLAVRWVATRHSFFSGVTSTVEGLPSSGWSPLLCLRHHLQAFITKEFCLFKLFYNLLAWWIFLGCTVVVLWCYLVYTIDNWLLSLWSLEYFLFLSQLKWRRGRISVF